MPDIHPTFLNGLIKRIAVLVGIFPLPDIAHDLGGQFDIRIRLLDGVFKTPPVPVDPGSVVAVQAGRLHGLAASGLLFRADQVLLGQGAVQAGRQGQPLAVSDYGCVRFPGMGVGIDQPENAPGQAIVHLVGSFGDHLLIGIDQQADVAAGTGRGSEILPDLPGHGIEIPGFVHGGIDIAVLAGLVDFGCGHIRTHMTFLAGVGFTGHLDGKRMPGMAGRAGTQTPVQVDPADTLIGPALDDGKLQFTGQFGIADLLTGHHQLGAVTVVAGLCPGIVVGRFEGDAAIFSFLGTDNAALQFLVQRVFGQVRIGVGHQVVGILGRFFGMADSTVLGADHDVDIIAVVFKGIGVGRGPLGVALGTPDRCPGQFGGDFPRGNLASQTFHCQGRLGCRFGVAAVLPILNDPGMQASVAIETFGRRIADRYLRSGQAYG